MPILTFRCAGCAAQWDAIVKLGEVPPCRKCGNDQVHSLVTYGAAPKGDFGTTRRNAAGQATQEFNFDSKEPEQMEFQFEKTQDEK